MVTKENDKIRFDLNVALDWGFLGVEAIIETLILSLQKINESTESEAVSIKCVTTERLLKQGLEVLRKD